MKNKFIGYTCFLITILSIFVSIIGITSQDVGDITQVTSVFGEEIELYGKGIYQLNSVSVAAQGIASDIVTLFIAIPLLIIGTIWYYKGSVKGQLFLLGILGYFLYTYMSYTFLWVYNDLFVLYIALMSLSLFTFIYLIFNVYQKNYKYSVPHKTNMKWIGIVQIIVSITIGLMWIGIIIQGIAKGTAPKIVEHYTTLVIQAMDLGFVVPAALISGICLIRRKSIGYLLTPVILTKGAMMLVAICAMMLNMTLEGVVVSNIQMILMPGFAILFIYTQIYYFKVVEISKG